MNPTAGKNQIRGKKNQLLGGKGEKRCRGGRAVDDGCLCRKGKDVIPRDCLMVRKMSKKKKSREKGSEVDSQER